MGPILAFTFGSVILDGELIKIGLFSEFLGLLVCLFVGFIGGLAAAPASMRDTPWPTFESSTRGTLSGLYVGVAIAIPSGIGTALSITLQNTASLVGVAISASLLPPAVNCGLLFAEASLSSYYYTSFCLINDWNATVWEQCCRGVVSTLSCPSSATYPDFCCTNTHYSPIQIANMGGISLLLTIVNIICIYIFGMATFKLKEVAPLKGKSSLWRQLVPETRAFNRAYNRGQVNLSELRHELKSQRVTSQPKRGVFSSGFATGVSMFYPSRHTSLIRQDGDIFSLDALFRRNDDNDLEF